ncbi:MAG: MAPEG family protein [Rhodospirillales bacterium]|nr:MAPEG family protein [Rhodospirillales bacterium]
METMMLPVTALYGGVLGLFALFLGIRITVMRSKKKIVLNDGGDAELTTAIRVFGNFAEYVPLALILLALAEINGASSAMTHWLGGALVVGRLLHLIGLDGTRMITFGRVAGMTITWGVILIASVLGLSRLI